MFNHYWIAVVTIILCSNVFAQDRGILNSPQNIKVNSSAEIHNINHKHIDSIPVRIMVSENEKKTAEAVEQRSKAHDESDLKAQWKAADSAAESVKYAKKQVTIAWWQIGLSVVTSVGFIISLIFNFMSLRQTRQAMSKAQKIGQAQLRAYLSISKVTLKKDSRAVWSTIENSGQTPAFSVEITSKCYQENLSFNTVSFGMIGPNTTRFHAFELAKPIANGHTDVHKLAGIKVAYTDTFGVKRKFEIDYFFSSIAHHEDDHFILFPCIGSKDEEEVGQSHPTSLSNPHSMLAPLDTSDTISEA